MTVIWSAPAFSKVPTTFLAPQSSDVNRFLVSESLQRSKAQSYWDEPTVHDINVNPVCTSRIYGPNFFSQTAEIR